MAANAAMIVVSLALALVVAVVGGNVTLTLKPFNPADFGGFLTTVLAIVVFAERAIEGIIQVLRGSKARELEQEIATLKQDVTTDASKLTALRNAERDREEYRQGTRTWAIALGFAGGFVLALGGIRFLGQFVTLPDVADLHRLAGERIQVYLFHFADILITAGIVAGGAQGIDMIARALGVPLKRGQGQQPGQNGAPGAAPPTPAAPAPAPAPAPGQGVG